VKHEPIAYLTGHKEFSAWIFGEQTRSHPPSGTELLVEEIIKNKTIKSVADIARFGLYRISLAKSNPNLKIFASDVSASALRVAKKNAAATKQTLSSKKATCSAVKKYPAGRRRCQSALPQHRS